MSGLRERIFVNCALIRERHHERNEGIQANRGMWSLIRLWVLGFGLRHAARMGSEWVELCYMMSTKSTDRFLVLPRKFIELVSVSLNAACTSLNSEGTRHHIRAALEAGATREEILFVLKCGSVLSIHCCSQAAPIVFEEAKAANVKLTPPANTEPTPACDAMRKMGQWNTAWDPFFALDPVFTDELMAMGAGIYKSGVMSPKEVELPQHRPRCVGHTHVCARHARC